MWKQVVGVSTAFAEVSSDGAGEAVEAGEYGGRDVPDFRLPRRFDMHLRHECLFSDHLPASIVCLCIEVLAEVVDGFCRVGVGEPLDGTEL